jgi:hypothetical protein
MHGERNSHNKVQRRQENLGEVNSKGERKRPWTIMLQESFAFLNALFIPKGLTESFKLKPTRDDLKPTSQLHRLTIVVQSPDYALRTGHCSDQ